MTDETIRAGEVEERTGLGVMDRAECVALLEISPIGRVAFVDDEGQPIALPVNYCWHDDAVVFRTLEGQKLFAAVTNQRVSFEVDRWDATSRTGESVLVKGKAAQVDVWAEREQLEQLGLAPWSDEKWRPIWIRIDPVEISGFQ